MIPKDIGEPVDVEDFTVTVTYQYRATKPENFSSARLEIPYNLNNKTLCTKLLEAHDLYPANN